MKKWSLILPVVFLMFASVAQATERPEKIEKNERKIVLNGALTITKYDDGRIAPVSTFLNLSEIQVNQVLSEMKLSNEQIEHYSPELKKRIISRGGVAVEIQSSLKHYYNSVDGTRYLITDENRDEVNAIKEKDSLTLMKQSNGGISTKAVIPIDTEKDGKWSASTSMIYQGLSSTGQEFKYDLYTEYNWDGQPNYYFSDSVVQYWDNATGISSASSYGANNWLPQVNNTIQQEAMTIVRKFGQSQGTFDLKHSHHNYGVIVDDLRVPRTLRGTNKQILASYAHPYIPGFVSAVMGIAGMSWPGLIGDDWYLDGTFTVQNT